jgi:hypothetical protein
MSADIATVQMEFRLKTLIIAFNKDVLLYHRMKGKQRLIGIRDEKSEEDRNN